MTPTLNLTLIPTLNPTQVTLRIKSILGQLSGLLLPCLDRQWLLCASVSNCKTSIVSHSRGLTIHLLFMEDIYRKVISKTGENREPFRLAMLDTTGASNGDGKLEGKQLKVLDQAVRSQRNLGKP